MKTLLNTFNAAFLLAFIAISPTWAATQEDAMALIKETTDKMIAALDANQEQLKANPQEVYKLIDEIMLPHFDFDRMSRFVLAQNWRNATPEQQTQFVAEFRDLLVRTYATAMVEAAGETVEVNYLPLRAEKGAKRIELRTEVMYKGQTMRIDYHLYQLNNEWKVYNIVAEGISLVTSYRNEFNNDISTIGMEGLIKKLKSRNQQQQGTDAS